VSPCRPKGYRFAYRLIALAEALVDSEHNVSEALKAWELEQLALGMHLWKRVKILGKLLSLSMAKKDG
jgi:hypothetical protein